MSWSVSLGEVTFPVAPAKISVECKSRNRTVTLIDGSQFVLAKKPALREYRMEVLLPRYDYPFAQYEGGFLPPEYFLEKLTRYAEERECVTLLIKRGKKSEIHSVYLGDMSISESADKGEDVTLTLTLTEGEEREVPAAPDTYTVRTGDTLRLIARRLWGDETLWNYLYGFNVNAIEAAAKRAGYADSRFGERLAVGLTLTVPQEVVSRG